MPEESRPLAAAYRGQTIAPVPTGYIEAYSRIGQGYAEMGKELGGNINKILESYAKANQEKEAVTTSWDAMKGTLGANIRTAEGENSTTYKQFQDDLVKFPTLSLTQQKNMLGSYAALPEQWKAAKTAEDVGADRVRRQMQEVSAAKEGIYNAAYANATIKVGDVTLKTQAEVDAMDAKLARDIQVAKEKGDDLGPVLRAREQFEAAKNEFSAKNLRAKSTLLVSADAFDAIAAKDPANAPPESAEMTRLKKEESKYYTISKGGVVTSGAIKQNGMPEVVLSGSPDLSLASTPSPEMIKLMDEQGIDIEGIEKDKDALKIDMLRAHLSALRLAEGGDTADRELIELNNNQDKPWALMIGSGLGIEGGRRLTRTILAARAAELATLPANLAAAGYSYARGTAAGARMAKDYPTLYKLAQAGKVAGRVGQNALRIGRSVGVTGLVEGAAHTAVGAGYGAIDQEGFSKGFDRYMEGQYQEMKDSFKSEIGLAESALEKQKEAIEARKKPRLIASEKLKVIRKAMEKEAAKPVPAGQARPAQIKLAESVQKVTEELQAGRTVEIPFGTNVETDPMIRAVIFHNPQVKNPDGTINMTLAAQVLSETLATKVDAESDRFVIKPIEVEPITYTQVDVESASNAEEAARMSIRNGVIRELKARGIPATADNITLAMTGSLTDEQGVSYDPEYSSGGVIRGKPLSSGGMTPLEQVKLQREQLGLQQDQIAARANRFGTRTQDPQTGQIRDVPISFSDTLARISPSDNPLVVGSSTTKNMELYRERLSSGTRLIEIVKNEIPNALRKLGADDPARGENYFVDANGKINGERLNGDERAKKEYVRVLFESVRELGKGLGPLSANDYYFIFTQAGIPVTYESVLAGKGDYIQQAITYLNSSYAQGGPDYYNNALNGLVSGAKNNMSRINSESNGEVKVSYASKSIASGGGLRPLAEVKEDLASQLTKLRTGQNNEALTLFAIMNEPQKFVSASGRFRTAADARAYAISALANMTGYDPQHIFEFSFKPAAKK